MLHYMVCNIHMKIVKVSIDQDLLETIKILSFIWKAISQTK